MSESKVLLQSGVGTARALGTCCCVHSKWRGGEKKEQKWVESNPTRGRNQHSKAGIYSGRAFSLSGWKKISLLFSLWEVTFCVYIWNVCACLCMQPVNWKVCLSYTYIYGHCGCPSHLLQKRWHFSFLISSFIPLLYFFSPSISPRLPSSHPNQRTHRPLLGTPCPGNPPCTARYLRNTKMAY